MPVYQYRGYKADGASATGIVDAESPKVARLKLRKDGVFPTEMAEHEGAKAIVARSGSGPVAGVGRSPALSVTDVALMTRQMATLLVAGLPLVDALGVLMDQTEKKSVKGLLADIREAIRGGASYSAVLERYPRDFSPIYVHMVRAGESSGALDQILYRLAEFLDKQLALKNKVTNAILYPAIMLVVGTLVLFFLVTFVVPKITAVFAHSKQALPWPTLVLMEVSHFCSDYWMVLLAMVLVGIWGTRRFMRTETGHVMSDRLLLKLPLIGQVARMVSISRLASTLATMLSSGVQLLDALDVSKRVMNNRILEQAVEEARQNIREGETIAEP
ncbi:MAG TPA: type II secretion system F family protein, partial [Nitrospira sp.]|nr:type II secretion system F family protein [Nitrospira sp.]